VKTYLVERYLPGTSATSMARGAARAERAAAQLTDEGTPVRFLGSTVLPDEEACFCRFEADSAEAVAEANALARFPFARIVCAIAIPAQGRSR
jgi:hypothetical protein